MTEVDSVPDSPTNESASTERLLRRVRKSQGGAAGSRARALYSDEQVNFVREAFLLDGHGIPWILERLHPPCSQTACWRIAIGRSYPSVPLSPRLLAAVAADEAARVESERRLREERREAPADAAEELLGGGGIPDDDEGGGDETEASDWA